MPLIQASIEGLPPGISATQFINLKDVAPEVIRAKGLKKAAHELLEFSDVSFNPDAFAKSLGLDGMGDLDWIVKSKEGNEWKKAVMKSVASQESQEDEVTKWKYPLIPKTAMDIGIYFQYLERIEHQWF